MDKDSQLIYEAYRKKKIQPEEPIEHSEGLIDDYRHRGYVDYYDPIQASGVEDVPECSSCGSVNTEYVGLIKRSQFGEKSIVSIKHCNDCGHEEEY